MNDTRITMMKLRNIDTTALQSRYAMRVAACLSEQAERGTHDVDERLRFARDSALAQARARRAAQPSPVLRASVGRSGVLTLSGGPSSLSPWWVKLASALPLLALVAGLVLIQNQHVRAQIEAAAEIDFDLLADELPPAAYSDPGFLEFLKSPSE